jgi:acyl-CoA thioesterase-2
LLVAPALAAEHVFGVSLDHTIWFHRPMRADRWHVHDVSCHHLHQGRGLAIGHVFDESGLHVATVAQEVLLRTRLP